MPKIASLELVALQFEIAPERAYGTSRGLNFRRQSALVKLTTDAGVVGYGEALGPVQPIRDYLNLVKSYFIGHSLYDFDVIASYCRNRLYHFGTGHFTGCLGAINVATIDAMGRTLGVPAHDLIGGRGVDKIPCYATTGYVMKSGLAGLEEQLTKVDTKCFTGAKIKIGLGPKSDVERVRLARKMLGDDILLMVDVNGNYTVDVAMQSLRAIEPYNIHWVEEPLPAHDIAGHADLRTRSPIPIATGEGLAGFDDFRHLAEARGIDILQPAIGRCGGMAEARHIARLAASFNLRIAPAVWGGACALAAGVHFLASLPPHPHTDNPAFPTMLEFDIAENPLRDDVTTKRMWPEPGGLAIPEGPGLGIAYDPERMEKFLTK